LWDDQLRCWVSDAEVVEVAYTAFTWKKGQAITAQLIVRRVRDRNRAAEGQGELFPVWRYHAVFINSPFQRGAGVRGLGRRAAGAPAIRLVPSERGLARVRSHGA
jgi:hypothetical protein